MKIPTTPLALRIAAICHRRPTTPWNETELRAYKNLYKAGVLAHEQDLTNLERYYEKHWPPDRDKNILRHDLQTLLNRFQGEIDRANIWAERHPVRPPARKIIPLPPIRSDEPPLLFTPEEVAGIERFQQQFTQFKKVKQAMGKSGSGLS